jgi:FkbM family methyltransferase
VSGAPWHRLTPFLRRVGEFLPVPLTKVLRRWAKKVVPPGFDEVALVYAALRSDGPGVMVDVGAHHGASLLPFADDGWRVYALEPDARNRAVLLRRFGKRLNVSVDPRAVSSTDDEIVTLFTSDVSTGISSLAPFHASHRGSEQVKTVRLDTFLAGVDRVSVLKTDTEGWDWPVLQTFPWERMRPRAIVCEFEDRKTMPLAYSYRDLANWLVALGYVVFVSEWYPVVEYGRRHRWRSLSRYPSPLADDRAWGNLIAVESDIADHIAAGAR